MGIFKRKDTGRYEVRVQIRGVKYRKYVPEARNKEQAKVAEADLRKEIFEGRYGRDGFEIGSTGFTEFCRKVYLPDIKGRLKVWKNEEYRVETLCRYFRGKRLKDITLIAIQKLRRFLLTNNSRQNRPRKTSTVKVILTTLSSVLNMAIECELLGLNPCRKLKWGKVNQKRDRVLFEDEEVRLMKELEKYPEAKAATILSLNTGLRRMGILQSKLGDVNAEKRTLRYIAKGGEQKMVPLNDVAWSVVEELMKRPDKDGYLFHSRTGHNLSANEGAFKMCVGRARIADFHFHDLRHSFADRIRRLTDAFTVRDLMGHQNVATTEIYVASDLEAMREAVNQLGKRKILPFSAQSFTYVSRS